MKNPLIIGFFLLIIKVFWTFREKVPEVKGESMFSKWSLLQPSLTLTFPIKLGHTVRSIRNPDEWNAALKVQRSHRIKPK